MRAEGVGCLVVTDRDRPVGVVTDRDIALHVLSDDRDAQQVRVADMMSAPAVTVRGDASLEAAVRTLRGARIRRVVLVDEAGRPVGVFSGDDLLRLLASEMEDLAEAVGAQLAGGASSGPGGAAEGSSHA